ncbi:MAG: FAD:protein FMN transferase [Clostridiales bacterium]|nr:FAD:protein FMN transferase [Clostridiales bacterium]
MKKLLFSILAIFMIILSNGCSKKTEPVSSTSFLLNTVSTITIYQSDGPIEPSVLISQCFSLCREYEKQLSRTVAGSDVSKINTADGKAVQIKKSTADVIQRSLDFYHLSQGYFDITIAPLSSLWDFQGEQPHVPTDIEIQKAISHINANVIQLSGDTVQLSDPEAAIDLGGIAKGYIADQAADFLKTNGVTSAIINLGGNIVTIGGLDESTPFQIGIQKPFDQQNAVIGSLFVSDKSVVTSGVYQRYFEENGKIYHHIIDPKTGYPKENNLLSVTIISDLSTDGDGLSTSCFLLGLEKGMELINSLENIEAIFIDQDYQLHFSDGIGTKIQYKPYET